MEKYGRRPDLDSWCSRCVERGTDTRKHTGMNTAGTARLGVGRTTAFYAAPVKAKRRGKFKVVRQAVVVHHCTYHGTEVEPLRVGSPA